LEKNQKTYSENLFQGKKTGKRIPKYLFKGKKNENPGIEKKHGWWKEEYSGLMSRGKNGKVKARKETRGMGKEKFVNLPIRPNRKTIYLIYVLY
jgi:hypothetical protein